MLFNRLTTKIFLSLTLGLVIFVSALVVYAQPTPTINYQGKLTDSTGLAVADGTYNMRFYLYNAVGVATTSAIWTETLTGTNKVQVTNGLFSVMLGSTTPLTSVDFNQALYLGVEIGGSGSPAWDGEMSPRKPLGTVPAAFESYKLGGVASSSFLRSDEPDTMSSTSASTLLTLIQSGTGDILNLFDGGTEVFTVVDGGNVGIGTSTPNSKLVVSGGTGVSNLLIIADSDNVDENDTATLSFSQDGGLITGSIGFNSDNHLILNQTGVNGGSGLAVNGTVGLLLANSGNVGIGTTTPGTKLTVEGGLQLTGAFKDTTNATGTAGYVLRTTGTSTQWVATSTLGLGNGTFLGLTDTPSSFTANRIPFTNSGATALTDSASLVFDGTNLGIGSTTPTARLTIQGTAGATTSLLQIASSTNATTFSVLASGDVEVPNSFISQGIKWTARTIPETNQWRSITYGNGLFVAVAANGTNQIMTSPDGITWTARTSPVASGWYGVTYGNGLFVAVANSGTNRVMTSPDGITWTARAASEANSWYSVTYGNGLFVAVSGDGTNQVMTSPDGITWTARAEAEANLWQSVTYGNGLFLAVAGSGTNRVMTSPDGITWTARAASEANNWYSVTYGNGLFVAVSQNGTNRVITSPTGTTWTARSASDVAAWTSVTYGNGLFVAVSDGAGRSMTSPDGLTWTGRTAADVNSYQSVTYGNGLFVAVAFGGANVMTSGKTFTNLLATNNIYQGGMSVLGGAFNIGTTTGTSSSFRNNILNIASTTGLSLFTILADGNVGIGTTTPYTKLTVAGGFGLTGSLYDKNGSAGTNGYILQTTGSGTQWVATSTLGLGNGTFLGLTDTPSSFTANRIPFTNSGATALTDSASLVFDGTNLGIGTSTPNSKLTVVGTAGSNPFTVASSTGSALLTILQNGNVGIGSSTPSQQLTVTTPGTYSGGLMIESSGGTYGPGIRIRNGGDGAREFGIYSTGSSNGPGAGSLEIYDRTAATTRLTIDSAGQLTLGSSVIDEELNIGPSDGSSDTMVRFTHENSNYAMGIDAGVDPKPFVIESRDTNRVLLSLLQNGNASVGTTSPWAKFTVQGTYGSTTALFDIASSTNSAGSATTSLFRVNVDGKIGIGTNNPDYKLTISSDETNTGIGATIRLNEEGAGQYASGWLVFSRDSVAANRKLGLIDFNNAFIESWTDESDADGGSLRFNTDNLSGSSQENLRITALGNIGIGTTTPNSKLTVAGDINLDGYYGLSINSRRVFIASSTINSILIGEGAGDSLTSGYTNGNNDNIFIGYQAGQNKAAGWDWANNGNIFVGYLTGKDANGAGSQNILFGQETGYAMSGDNNSFIGFQAGYDSSGDNNNFMGQMAGYTNSGGGNNYFGYNAATLIDAGDDNIAIGTAALRGGSGDPWATSSNAARNIALGYQAGYSANGGNNNILIGHDTANNLTSGDNNIVIGYDIDLLSATQSNTLNIGNLLFGTSLNGTGTATSTGNIGIGTTTPSSKLTVQGTIQATNLLGGAVNLTTDASGNIIRDPSDVRLKENIQTLEDSLDKVLQLRGVSYEWIDKERFGEQTEIGFIAQELDEVLPEVVRKGGDYWSVNTRNIIAVVVEAVKEIYARLVTNEAKVQDLENRVHYLESLIEQQSAETDGSASGGGGSTPPPEEPVVEETPPAPEPVVEEPAPESPPEEPVVEETSPAPEPVVEEPAPESP